jgi:hypothetical protein
MKLDPAPDWGEVEQFILQSYRMIAPRKLVKELDARDGAGASPAPRPAPRRATAKKAVEARAKTTKGAKPAKRAKAH